MKNYSANRYSSVLICRAGAQRSREGIFYAELGLSVPGMEIL
jgi:hypothetical protein